jgi:WD40 repeat protein
VLIAGVVAIFLTAFLLVSLSYWRAEEQRRQASVARDQAIQHEQAERWERYRANLATVSSAQTSQFVATARRVLLTAPIQHRNWEWYHFHSQLDGSQRVLALKQGTAQPVFLSNHLLAAVNRHLQLWEVGTGQPPATVPDWARREVKWHKVSPDGRWLACFSGETELTIWDIATGKQRASFRGSKDWCRTLEEIAFSPDGQCLYTFSTDRRLRAWDTTTGRLLWTSTELSPRGDAMRVTMGARHYLLNFPDGTAHLFDYSGRRLHVLPVRANNLAWIAFNRQGTRLVTSEPYPRNVIRLWDTETGKEVAVLKGHRNEAFPVVFSPDGTRIASGSLDQTVRLWDGRTGAAIALLRGHNGRVRTVVFSPDGKRLLSGSEDRTLRLWDAETGESLAVLVGHSGAVTDVVYSPDGKYICSRGSDGTFRLWDAYRVEHNGVLKGHTSYVYGAVFHPDSRRVVSASWDGTVRVWDATTSQEKVRVRIKNQPILTAVAVHPGGRLLAVRGRDDTVRLWDLESGAQVHQWSLPTNSFVDSRLVFSRKGDLLAAGGWDSTVHVWEVESRKTVAVLRGAVNAAARDIVFSPDNRWLASGGYNADQGICIWDLQTSKPMQFLRGHRRTILSLAVSTDGHLLASGSEDGTIRLWDTRTWKEVGLLQHETNVYGLAFSPDDTRLAAACGDSVIRLWDVATRQDVAELRGHSDYVYTLSFSPDGTRLVSGSGDFTVRVWDTLSPAERDGAASERGAEKR